MFAAIASIAAAVPIPVSADLEAGVGDSLDDVQRTFTRAIAIGCAGGSLEDVADYATPGQFVLRSRQDATERVRAAIDMLHRGRFAYAGEALSGEVMDGVMD